MAVLSFIIIAAIGIPIFRGFVHTRKQRNGDRRHFAEFLGFTAGLVGIVATLLYLTTAIVWFRPGVVPYYHPTTQGIVFICGIVGLLSSLVAVIAGLFGRGVRRITLIIFGPVMAVIYLLSAFSNFGA